MATGWKPALAPSHSLPLPKPLFLWLQGEDLDFWLSTTPPPAAVPIPAPSTVSAGPTLSLLRVSPICSPRSWRVAGIAPAVLQQTQVPCGMPWVKPCAHTALLAFCTRGLCLLSYGTLCLVDGLSTKILWKMSPALNWGQHWLSRIQSSHIAPQAAVPEQLGCHPTGNIPALPVSAGRTCCERCRPH